MTAAALSQLCFSPSPSNNAPKNVPTASVTVVSTSPTVEMAVLMPSIAPSTLPAASSPKAAVSPAENAAVNPAPLSNAAPNAVTPSPSLATMPCKASLCVYASTAAAPSPTTSGFTPESSVRTLPPFSSREPAAAAIAPMRKMAFFVPSSSALNLPIILVMPCTTPRAAGISQSDSAIAMSCAPLSRIARSPLRLSPIVAAISSAAPPQAYMPSVIASSASGPCLSVARIPLSDSSPKIAPSAASRWLAVMLLVALSISRMIAAYER